MNNVNVIAAGSTNAHSVGTNYLNFCHVNIRSLLKISDVGARIDQLKQFLIENDVDVCALSETHLDSNVNEDLINIEGFSVFRKDRNKFGGGVAFYIREDMIVKVLTGLSIDGIETLWLKTNIGPKNVIFGVCYRPPNQSSDEINFFLDALYATFDILNVDHPNCQVVFLGDFNDRCTEWNSNHDDSELGLRFYNLIHSFGYSQLIDEPTRGLNLLDLIITKNRESILNFKVCDPFDNLDHCPIYGTMNLCVKKPESYKRVIRKYSEENLSQLQTNLSDVPWHVLFHSDLDCNELVNIYTHVVQSEIDTCIPPKEVLIRPRDKPGMNTYVKKLFRKCHRYHRIAQRTKNQVDIENHRVARKAAKAAWKHAKDEHVKRLYSKMTNPVQCQKNYWKFMKTIVGVKQMSIPTLICDGLNYTSSVDKCELLNSFFVDQTKLNCTSEPKLPVLTMKTDDYLSHIEVSESEVIRILKSLNISKASGLDNISNLILKNNADILAKPITYIANKSLTSGVFPSDWKQAIVTPVFKNGDRQDYRNYRPISLLSCTSKVLERVVYNNLYEHCVKNNLLSHRNSGFKKNDGVVNRLLHIVNKIYRGLDDEKEIAMAFLDISKAFDRVWHTGLLFKLKSFGVSGNILNWFKSYLGNRSQKVVINGVSSSLDKLFAGVPQGSILGPLLFLIFVQDIEENIISDINLFADDTALIQEYNLCSDVEQILNHDLKLISNWGKQWLVTFNPDKTVFMNFSLKRYKSYPQIMFNNVAIKQVSEQKHLGIILSDDMKWTKHVDYICRKAHKKIGILYRCSVYLCLKQMTMYYKSSIRPVIEFASVVFDGCSNREKLRLENVQRRAALVCTGALKRTESVKLLNDLEWESISSRRTNAKLILFYKIMNGKTPAYLANLLPQNAVCERYNLRHVVNKTCVKSRLRAYEMSYFPSTIKCWNNLPVNVLSSESVAVFKNRLLAWHSINERGEIAFKAHLLPFCAGYYGRLLNQIRYNLSPLRSHLFTYNIVEHPLCPGCHDWVETSKHFFFACVCYSVSRVEMKLKLQNIFQTFELNYDILDEDKLLFVILHGIDPASHDLAKTINEQLYNCVTNYMCKTRRFVKS